MALGMTGNDATGDTLSAQAHGQMLANESTTAQNTDLVRWHLTIPLATASADKDFEHDEAQKQPIFSR
jgi:hypothetical protein